MGINKIVSLDAVREVRNMEKEDFAYQALIHGMDKLELLEEMVRFQEERSRLGHLTIQMMIRGKHLFQALEKSAETRELKLLTGSYKRHLEHELSAYRRSGKIGDQSSELSMSLPLAEEQR